MSADKSEGREEGVEEGREERREGAFLLCFDGATGVRQQGHHTGSGHVHFLKGFCRLSLYKIRVRNGHHLGHGDRRGHGKFNQDHGELT